MILFPRECQVFEPFTPILCLGSVALIFHTHDEVGHYGGTSSTCLRHRLLLQTMTHEYVFILSFGGLNNPAELYIASKSAIIRSPQQFYWTITAIPLHTRLSFALEENRYKVAEPPL